MIHILLFIIFSMLSIVKISGIDMKTVKGRDLIIIEDIIDTGTTMSKLIPALEEYGPKSVRVAALLEKRTHKSCGFKGDFVGFSIPDAFVVGKYYGLIMNRIVFYFFFPFT